MGSVSLFTTAQSGPRMTNLLLVTTSSFRNSERFVNKESSK